MRRYNMTAAHHPYARQWFRHAPPPVRERERERAD